uniref:DEK_C domain-containing protein n=1 Tax=Strongyloides venezuelensis TaxID=75913 RepID=A0A0K0EU99_STRVS
MAETEVKLNTTEEPVINNNKTIEEGTENGTILKAPEDDKKAEVLPNDDKKDIVEEEICKKIIVEPQTKDNEEVKEDTNKEVTEDSKTELKSEEKVEENKVEEVVTSDKVVVEEKKVEESKDNEIKPEPVDTEPKLEKEDMTCHEETEPIKEDVKEEKVDSDVKESLNTSENVEVKEPPLSVEKPKGRGRKAAQGTPKLKDPVATENGESIANSRPRRSTVKNVDYTGADTAAIWSALTPKGSAKKKTTNTKSVTSSVKKGRGRKRKTSFDGDEDLSEELSDPEPVDKTPKKGGRGKGGQKKPKTSDDDDEDFSEVLPTSKKRGAPKDRAPLEKTEPKKRGRPSKGNVSVNGDDIKDIDTKDDEQNAVPINETNDKEEEKMDTSTNCEKTAVETN